VIRDERGIPFLYRYHLFTFGYDGPGLCIHHFVKSDPDRGYHDHPWSSALSFILCGGYEERIVNSASAIIESDRNNRSDTKIPSFDVYQRNRWNFNYLDGVKNFHRVIIPENGDAWTLFGFRGRSKTWGMINLEGKYYPMSTQISDADGGWWNLVGNGYSLHNHLDLVGKVIATVDCVIIAESKVLLIKRGKEPHKDKWAFPGGRIEQTDENILSAAIRELKEETHLQNVELKYIKTIGNNSRDPRGFCLTNVFLAQLDKIPCGVRAGDDAVDYTWFSIYDGLPEMAFDHKEILQTFIQM
jgi:8-oxo-dGTP diphosphatase